MTVFTNVSDDVLEPGDPIRSVDILAIKENTNYNHENTVLEILQEDIFTTSGTFTKATGFDDDDTVMIFLIGGGASGAAARLGPTSTDGVAAGGCAGCCLVISARYADATTAAWTLTVGAGGNARTINFDADNLEGVDGSFTTLINTTINSMLVAGGGSRSRSFRGSSQQTVLRVQSNDRLSPVYFVNGLRGSIFAKSPLDVGGPFGSLYESAAIGNTNLPPSLIHTHMPAASRSELQNSLSIDFRRTIPNSQVFGSGGSAARQGATNRSSWNPKVPALFNTGGDGSGTSNGQNATGIGGGGGGCVRPAGTTAVSGAGGNGGMIVRYYRGRVSPLQVLS